MSPVSLKMGAQEMAALNREYVFFSWSVQSAINPIPAERAEGIYFWDVDGKRYLVENAQAMGQVLGQELEEMKAKHPSVGDVRYIGLFSVIEVVKDKETKEPMAPWNAKPSEMGAMADVAKFLRDNGLYTFVRWNWIFAVPPLCITESQLKDGLAIIDKALEITDTTAR